MALSLFFLAAGLFSISANAVVTPRLPINARQAQSLNASLPVFPDIKPSKELKWTDCYSENLQCAYLTVPLDYADPSVGTTDIAFMRYLLSEQAEDLISNPGGPGESGVEWVQSYGAKIAKKWGYNFVSNDPRAVNFTKLRVSCGKNTTLTRRDDEDGSLAEIWNKNLRDNSNCSKFNKDSNAKYVGTSATIQDMVHFSELQAKLRGKDPKKTLINYYGVSYGTLLGQTLVAMYPDRLRRVLIDANIYGPTYYQGWEPSSMADFAYGVHLFTKLCYEAGPEYCSLATNATSAIEVQARFDSVIKKLYKGEILEDGAPLSVVSFLETVQSSLYFPRTDSDDHGHYTSLANTTMRMFLGRDDAPRLIKREYTSNDLQDAYAIITSVDIAGRFPFKTYEQFKVAMDELNRTSEYDAALYASSGGLTGLASDFIPPPSQYFPGFKPIKPSCPVLFANTKGDPVTPDFNAREMSKIFAGSAVVLVDGPGHSTSQAPSKCADAILTAYMKNGTVPADQETLCTTDVNANYYFNGPAEDWTQNL